MDLAVECIGIASQRTRRGSAVLMNQVMRSAISIPSNIAEGAGRDSTRDYLRHLGIANGSLKELETQLILAERVGFERRERVEDALAVADESGRLLTGLRQSLRRRSRK